MFDGVESKTIGDHGRLGGAAGEEIDRHDFEFGSPPHSLVVASARGFGPEMLKAKEEFLFTAPYDSDDPDIRADVVFFETDQGGAVFSVGSIAWAGSLGRDDYNNDLARLTGNVLRRFRDPEPFPLPAGMDEVVRK
jgi:N,N-dimethylformamidase